MQRLAIAAGVLLLISCRTIEMHQLRSPTISVGDVSTGTGTLDVATLFATVRIANPNPFPIEYAGGSAIVTTHDIRVLEASLQPGGAIRARGEAAVRLVLQIPFGLIPASVAEGGRAPLSAQLLLRIRTPVGDLDIPFGFTHGLLMPQTPQVHVQEIHREHVTFAQTEATLRISIDNPNDFALTLGALDARLTQLDRMVAAVHRDPGAEVPARGSQVLSLPFVSSVMETGSAQLMGNITVGGRVFPIDDLVPVR